MSSTINNTKMRKATFLIALLAMLLGVPAGMQAQQTVVSSAKQLAEPQEVTQRVSPQPAHAVQLATIGQQPTLYTGTLKVQSKPKQGKTATPMRRAPKRVSSASDIAGTYVWTSSSLTGSFEGGHSVTVAAQDADTITLTGFGGSGYVVKAKVDAAAGKFYIPNQVVAVDTTNNWNVDVCYFTITGGKAVIDRDKPVTGTINADGSLQIDDYWGYFVADGSRKDAVYQAWSDTKLDVANGRLYFTMNSNTYAYNVAINQISSNVVQVKNFAGQGHTVEIELQRDSTATIASQVAMYDSNYGNFQTVAVVDPTATTVTSANFTSTITCDKATGNKRISWGPWSLLASSAYAGYRLTGYIEYNDQNATFTYPALSVSSFEGSGTEADPYQIKQLDDLILLSDNVKAWETTDSVGSYDIHRAYQGKWFRVMNDIDMQNYRFTPIGNAYKYLFAGNLDGGGHTLKNLNVSSTVGYAGLFGRVDSLTTIKDLTFDSPTINNTGSFTGALAGWASGTIDNVHVVNAKITGSGMATGGIIGTGSTITNSSVVNSSITGAYGYVGGVAGELDGGISNSFATGVAIVEGGGDYNPVGGVVGNLYGASAEKCYFTGSVYTSSSNQRIGGVFGTAYNATIDQVFSRGYVRGYDTKTQAGGVVGMLAASKLSNAYSTSTVISSSAVACGGITGMVAKNRVGTDSIESSVVNAFSAGFVDAETYQYDAKNGVREALGTIADGSNPTLSGIYFDNQITNNNSVRFSTPTATLTSGTALDGYDTSVWTFQSGYYPRLKFAESTDAAAYASSAIIFAEGNSPENMAKTAKVNALGNAKFKLVKGGQTGTEGNYMSISGSDLVLNGGYGTDTLYVVNGRDSLSYAIKAAPVTLDGAGTEANPYQIKTKADMIYLSDLTTNKNLYFPQTYFQVMNDIDMELDTAFVGFANNPDDAYSRFAGVFDGAGHTLHNLYLGGYVKWSTKPTGSFGDGTGDPSTGSNGSKGWNGLFSRLDLNGVVKNLTIAADAKLEFWATAGPFVGDNYGLIENCRNYAEVKGLSCWIGGIVGRNEKEGIIRNCLNAGNVATGYMDVGGIAGASTGTIENCMNTGAITVEQLSEFISTSVTRDVNRMRYAGGITGSQSAGTIRNSVNAGTVYAYTSMVGGIAGNISKPTDSYADVGLSDIISSVSYGTVITRDQGLIGGFTGSNESDGAKNANNYFDKQVAPYASGGASEINGTTGVETSTLISGQKLAGLADSIYQFEQGKYPVLKQFANDSIVKTAASVIPQIGAGETAYDLKSDITLSAPATTTWQLTQGTSFKLDGSKVVVPASVSSLQVDTLVAASPGFTKVMILKQRYPFPLEGNGTQASPFLIKTPQDWNAVSDYMVDCAESFKDQYLRVENDIDFSSETFKQLGRDFITPMNGDFDGNGKTISGITNKSNANNEGGGAFSVIGENGYVHDLTLAGKMTATHTYAAGFAGDVYGRVKNCVNEIDVTSTQANAAGFVAHAYGTAEFDSCYNRANISSSHANVAGFAAQVYSGAKFNVCGNEGKVSQTGTANYIAGFASTSAPATYNGVYNKGEISVARTNNTTLAAGLIANVSGAGTLSIKKSYNTASITAKGNVAGLITASSTFTTVVEMDSCYNTGDVIAAATSSTSNSPTAGLMSFYSVGTKVTNSWNSGTIMSEKNVYTAGLIAKNASGTASVPTIVSNCYNLGDVTANGNQGGGIVGYSMNKNMVIENCYNAGRIDGGFGLGGIVASFTGDTTNVIRNCYNTGDIATSTNRSGGLIGYGNGKGTVENCFNIGNISTSLTAGGTNGTKSGYAIGGLAGISSSHFYNCYNTGTVTGASYVGGLVGQPARVTTLTTGNATEFHNCYNAGKIVVTTDGLSDEQKADTCGNIIGTTYSRLWNENNVMENTYFLSDQNAANAHDAQATGLDAAAMAKLDLGSAFKHNDDYSLPVLTVFADSAAARFSGVIPVAAEGDSWQHITKAFYVGQTDGLTWTADSANITFNGNVAGFNQPYTGQFTVTAKLGSWSKTFTLNADNTTGISSIATGKELKSQRYYTVDGMEVSPSQVRRGQVLIIRKTYTDGTQTTEKTVR